MRYYKLNEIELQKELETDFENGLSSSQADERFKECGYNTTYSKPSVSFKSVNVVFLVVSSVMVFIYLIAGIFNIKNGFDYFYLAIASALIFILSQLITCVFDYLIDRDMYFSSLEKTDTLTVLRDGEKIRVKYSEIVYGDIVYLNKGDYIPFDGVIVSSNGLVTDESDLSGSDRASKRVGIISDDNVSISNLFNSVFCGSFVIHGKAKVAVTDVCNRVYIVKSGLKQSKKAKHSFKNVDAATLFTTIISALCIVFSIACGLISKEFIGIITSSVFFIAFAFSGFTKIFAKHSFKKIFLDLKKKNIFLKSFDELESLSNADVMLLEHDMVFDDKVEICSFLTESFERKSVHDIGKNNFATFLYAVMCLEEATPLFKSCCKLLKKIGINYHEISSLCPLLSRSVKNVNGVKICARAYDGSNLLIAVGPYNYIEKLCIGPHDEEKILKLGSESTETIAVAIKKVDVISDDLSSQLNDFSFAGIIGVNRKLSVNISRKVKNLNEFGIHPIILFPGNKQAAISTFGEKIRLISKQDFLNLTSKDIGNIDVICDYSGEKEEIVSFISSLGLIPGYFGDKILRDKKCISFKADLMSRYEIRDADVVCPYTFSSVYAVFGKAKKSTYLIRNAFEYNILCPAFYSVCGILFSLLFKELLISTVTLALLLLMIVPLLLYFKLFMGITDKEIMTYGVGRDIVSRQNVLFSIATVVAFLLIMVVTRFITASDISAGFLIVTFVTYLFFSVYDIKKAPVRCALGIIIPIVVSILFMMPCSFVFGNVSGGIIITLLSLLIGAALKITITVLCRLVKN